MDSAKWRGAAILGEDICDGDFKRNQFSPGARKHQEVATVCQGLRGFVLAAEVV